MSSAVGGCEDGQELQRKSAEGGAKRIRSEQIHGTYMEKLWKISGTDGKSMEHGNIFSRIRRTGGISNHQTAFCAAIWWSSGDGEKTCVFFENRKVTSINTSLILPHWKIWLIFDLKRFSGSLFLFKSIHVRTRGPKTTADFASIYLSFTQRYGMFGMNPHINQNIMVRCWWDRYLKKTQLVAIWTKWVD